MWCAGRARALVSARATARSVPRSACHRAARARSASTDAAPISPARRSGDGLLLAMRAPAARRMARYIASRCSMPFRSIAASANPSSRRKRQQVLEPLAWRRQRVDRQVAIGRHQRIEPDRLHRFQISHGQQPPSDRTCATAPRPARRRTDSPGLRRRSFRRCAPDRAAAALPPSAHRPAYRSAPSPRKSRNAP